LLHLTENEIEQIAQWEHTRWSWEKRFQGWVYEESERDLEKKTSPYLLPWCQLPDDIKNCDYEPTLLIPQLLHQAGYKAMKRKA
jgi:hypothetical protein